MARSQTKIKSKDNILDYILLVIFIGVIIVTLYPFLDLLRDVNTIFDFFA